MPSVARSATPLRKDRTLGRRHADTTDRGRGGLLVALGLWSLPGQAGCPHGCVSGHAEGLSLSPFGRFGDGVLPVDAFSGSLPVYYHFLSGSLRNALAWAIDVPPVLLDPVLGRLLPAALFASLFAGLRLAGARAVPAAATGLMAVLFTDAATYHALHAVLPEGHALATTFEGARHMFHTPANMLGTAVADAFALVLAPLAIVAYVRLARRPDPLRAGAAGLATAALLLTHSLLGMAVLLAAMAAEAAALLRGRSLPGRLRLLALVPLALLPLLSHSSAALLALSTSAIGLGLLVRGGWIAAAAFGVPMAGAASLIAASLVAADYLGLGGVAFELQVPVAVQALVLGPVALLVALAARRRSDPAMLAALAMTGMVAVLGLGSFWGLDNHAYRFTTFLIVFAAFPLALGWTAGAMRPAALALPPALWLAAGVALNLADRPRADPSKIPAVTDWNYDYGRQVTPLRRSERGILDRLARLTAEEGGRPLLLPTVGYPLDSARNGIVASWSATPGLIGDPRYTRRTSDRPWILLACAAFGGVDLSGAYHYAHRPDVEGLRAACAAGGALPAAPPDRPVYLILADAGPLAGFASEADLAPPAGLRLVAVARDDDVTLWELCVPRAASARCAPDGAPDVTAIRASGR